MNNRKAGCCETCWNKDVYHNFALNLGCSCHFDVISILGKLEVDSEKCGKFYLNTSDR